MRLFASKEYLEKFSTPKTPEDLDHHRLITYGGNSVHPYLNTNWILHAGRRPEQTREPFMIINSTHARFTAAKLGLGIVELGEDHPRIENAELVEVLPHIEGPKVEIYYTYPVHLKNSKRITALADYLEDILVKENPANGKTEKNEAIEKVAKDLHA